MTPWTDIRVLFLLISVFFVNFTEGRFDWSWLWGPRSNCYRSPPIGCFSTSHPYTNTGVPGGTAPKGPNRQTIEFQFLRHGNEKVVFRFENAREVLQSVYNSTQKTVVIIHGYKESPSRSWIGEMTHEIFTREPEVNVIVVDWHDGASEFMYVQSVANTRVVGAVLALVIKEMQRQGGDLQSFHLIGFSLGAHLAGYAGERLPGLGRITGLDPAGPSFRDADPRVRLDQNDANFVDVYHTDSDDVTGLGLYTPMGTVDFYLNGGKRQPGCQHHVLDRLAQALQNGLGFGSTAVYQAVTCAHSRAYKFFKSTINSRCQYSVLACRTIQHMRVGRCHMCGGTGGERCPMPGYNLGAADLDIASIGQIFNLRTTASAPYCGLTRQEPTLNKFVEVSRRVLCRSWPLLCEG